jgi:D-alanine-D-alanine ligase-like ATP-grasp enzyme
MHQIMLQVVHSVRYKLQRKIGYFGIYGYDFMIDEDMKAWLIEINVNPAITCNTDTLIKAIPPAIEEGIRNYLNFILFILDIYIIILFNL